MFKKITVLFFLLWVFGGFSGISLAADPPQTHKLERPYGWNLMTHEERVEHQAKMRAHKTAKEREQFRIEHHKKMQERAKEQGITFPDQPRIGKRDGMVPGEKRRGGGGRRR